MLCETPLNYNTSIKEKDKSFKVLFEVKEQFIQLLKTFVEDKWVDEVNVNNIELVDKEFTTVNLEERRADVIYKINLSDREIYFFLLEVQSYVDKMPWLKYVRLWFSRTRAVRKTNTRGRCGPI